MITEEPREPEFEIGVDPIEYADRWANWARQVIELRDRRISTLIVESESARRELKTTKELIEAYRKIQDASDRLKLYEVGDTVYLGPNHLQAKVLGIFLGENKSISYQVGWWLGDNRLEATVPSSEVEGDEPLKE